MDFEWDSTKAAANIRKHGVSFEEAVSALQDDLAATARDLSHSQLSSALSLSAFLRTVGCLPFPIRNARIKFGSSAHAWRRERKGKSMKKIKTEAGDWLRPEYKRSDLGSIVRGKYARRMAAESNIVRIDPTISKAFPNEAAVNAALRGLLELAKSSTRPVRTRSKSVRAG